LDTKLIIPFILLFQSRVKQSVKHLSKGKKTFLHFHFALPMNLENRSSRLRAGLAVPYSSRRMLLVKVYKNQVKGLFGIMIRIDHLAIKEDAFQSHYSTNSKHLLSLPTILLLHRQLRTRTKVGIKLAELQFQVSRFLIINFWIHFSMDFGSPSTSLLIRATVSLPPLIIIGKFIIKNTFTL